MRATKLEKGNMAHSTDVIAEGVPVEMFEPGSLILLAKIAKMNGMLGLILALLGSVNNPVAMSSQTIAGTPVQVISVDMSDPNIELGVVVPSGFPGSDESFSKLVSGGDILAGVNGAYFDKGTKRPIGDIVIEGNLVHSGRMGTAISISDEGKIDIERVTRHKTMRWPGKKIVVACGPALVLDGEVDVEYQQEGFRDPHVTGSTQRMAIGYNKDRRVLLVHLKKAVTFAQEANVMKVLGCFEAMNLDAGASLGMAFQGKVVLTPSRRLASAIVVRRSR